MLGLQKPLDHRPRSMGHGRLEEGVKGSWIRDIDACAGVMGGPLAGGVYVVGQVVSGKSRGKAWTKGTVTRVNADVTYVIRYALDWEKIVPLPLVTVEWTMYTKGASHTCQRTQIPLSGAEAQTFHKAQGATFGPEFVVEVINWFL